MTATAMPAPSAPPSLDNPLTLGQTLWIISHRRGGPVLIEGTVTDLKSHWAEITTTRPAANPDEAIYGGRRDSEWIDARDLHSPWLRHQPSAVLRLASLYPFGSVPWLAATLIRIWQDMGGLQRCALRSIHGMRPGKWAMHVRGLNVLSPECPHPKTIARSFRWLAGQGMASRHGGRKARWQILNS